MKTVKISGGRLYEIPLSDIEHIGYFQGKNSNETVKTAYSRLTKERGRAPDFLMNAELFDFVTRRAASDVVSNGEIQRLTEGYGMAFPKNKTAVFSYKNNVNADDYVGAYPVLVRNGIAETSEPKGIGGVRGRTALGLSEKSLYITLIPDNGGISLAGLRKKLISNGVKNAINLDGGGSTQFYAPCGNYFSGRHVRGFVGIWLKKNEPAKTEPVKSEPAKTVKADVRTVTARKGLNVRSGPGLFHKRVGGLAKGTKVTVLETSGTWCRIGEGRWVSSLYLKK